MHAGFLDFFRNIGTYLTIWRARDIISPYRNYKGVTPFPSQHTAYTETMRRLSTAKPPKSALISSPSELGQVIRARRLASALRIDDAAALCGVSADLLSRLENGHSGVTSERLLRVLDGLGLTLLVLDKASVPAALRALSQAAPEKTIP